MRTELFARRPLLWLDLADRLGVTVLCSPNFGFQHYLKQYGLKARPQLDLSAVRLIFNGAEPIAADLCRRFMQTLAAHGLQAERHAHGLRPGRGQPRGQLPAPRRAAGDAAPRPRRLARRRAGPSAPRRPAR